MTRKKDRTVNDRRELAAAYGITVPQPDETTLSPNEVGQLLGVSGEAVKVWIYNRRLPAFKLKNGHWRVKKADLQNFLNARHETIKRKVVFVTRDSEIFGPITQALHELNCEPVLTNSASDALLKISGTNPALCIIDIHDFPDGWVLAGKVKSFSKYRTPVLFLNYQPENTGEQEVQKKGWPHWRETRQNPAMKSDTTNIQTIMTAPVKCSAPRY